ncbi:MAG TPA: cytochrome c oxidase subunit 3 [Sphingomicrobium sp.]|nr:cytochrome c oxidase subunit 3 [Sphingomicrobium sp.]
MILPRFTDDLADLPTHKFGPSSLTWWGIIAFMVIEGGFFMLTFAAYFFLMGHEQGWPPEGRQAPDVLAGTLFTIVIILSEIPNTMIKKAARAGDIPAIRRLILVMTAVGAILLVIRGFEFNSLNCRWTDDAYGSIIWALLLLHTTHLITDWGDTVVLGALIYTPVAYEGRRQVDVDENSLYWRYVWLLWLPIYLMIYWVPRL